LSPEGPQRDDLADDIAAALAASPAAAAFFDALAQFYRKAYLRWIDGTKRRADVRAARIAEVVDLLAAGRSEDHPLRAVQRVEVSVLRVAGGADPPPGRAALPGRHDHVEVVVGPGQR